MNWKEIYKSRLICVEEAVSYIKSGDHISIHGGAAEPLGLLEGLLKRTDLKDVMTTHMGTVVGHCAEPEYEGIFRHNSFFTGPSPVTIKAVNEGRADMTPIYLSEIPEYYRDYNPPDVVLIHVSPPDEYGYVSLGVSTTHAPAAIENCKRLVIAQVNKRMPVTCGQSLIHVSKIDYFVEQDRQIIQVPMSPTGEEENMIGNNIASLINDGDCLQLGFGGIPDAILKFLHDKKDLGVHSEMFSDSVIELVKNGVINGSRKNIDRGKMVTSFIVGTDKIYDFAHKNLLVEMRPIDYVNDPFVIGQIDNMVSINACIQVDLLGQIASDTIGYKQFAGVGGQVDFVRGAARSKGGKSIIAMASTANGGKRSRIVPILDEGAVVTTNRYDADYIVTENGIADLRFKTRKERTEMLISIAHPKFRDELIENARKRNLI
jgi:4-hydroxybutyrate CoA-transferase